MAMTEKRPGCSPGELQKQEQEKAALENEQELIITLNSIGDAVITTDIRSRITRMNPEAERLCGCKLENAKGKNLEEVFNIVNAHTGKKVKNPVKHALRLGKVVGLANHTKLISKNGKEYQIADSASPIKDGGGNVIGVVMVFRDVTREYTMRERLRLSEERLNLAMMVKNDGLWDWNLISNNTYFDDRYYTMAGYAPGEFPNTFAGWAQNVHPDDLQMAQDAIKAYLGGASDNFDIEFRFRRKNGKWMWIQGKGKIVARDEKGRPLRMIGTHTDITDRKNAEKELQNSNERLLTVFNGINAFVYICDMETHEVLFVNDFGLKVWGSDITGQKCHKALQGLDKPCSFCTNDKLVDEDGQPTGVYEWEFQNSVNKRWYDIRDSAIRWTDGRLVRMEVAIDITDRKISQEQIQESEERFQRMLSLIPDMISIHDKDFNIVYSNWKGFAAVDEAKRQLYTKCYKTYRDLDEICPDCRAKEVLRTKKAFHTEAELPDGTWIDLRVIPVLNEDGELELFVEWVRDITKLKKSIDTKEFLKQIANELVLNFNIKDLIRAVEKHLSKLIDTSNFYIALYDKQTGMFHAPFEKDKKDQIDSWPALQSVTGLVLKSKQSLLIKKQDIIHLIETNKIDQTGTICEAWLGVPLLTENDVTGVIVVQSYDDADAFDTDSTDILEYVSTQISIALERTKIFEDLVQAKLKAEESDRLKSAFLANMSHEIRTPMNAILGFLSLLKEPRFDEEQRAEFIDVVNKSGHRLLETINDIIEFSKIEAGQIEINHEEVDLSEIIHNYYQLFLPQVREKGLILNLSENIPEGQARVYADRHKLEGVLINLINNAIKFTNKGSIEIGYYLKDNEVVFYVKDTGIGIPEDRQKVVFDRFVQADLEITRPHEGSGLGLSIAKAYVEALGGSIWLESIPGTGSTFYFSIPGVHYEKKKKVQDKYVDEHSVPKLPNLTILVAEDDDMGFYFLQTIFNKEGIHTLHATTGEEAIELFRSHNDIDLILMDIKMPGMGGLEATKTIKKEKPEMPVIAVTAFALPGDKEKILRSGCDEYISKPFKKEEILEVMQRYV